MVMNVVDRAQIEHEMSKRQRLEHERDAYVSCHQ